MMVTATKQPVQSNGKKVACRKCKSTQIIASKRGYSFGLMFKVLFTVISIVIVFGAVSGLLTNSFIGVPSLIILIIFFSLPITLLGGFVGRNDIVNGCMNCGNKWKAGKK